MRQQACPNGYRVWYAGRIAQSVQKDRAKEFNAVLSNSVVRQNLENHCWECEGGWLHIGHLPIVVVVAYSVYFIGQVAQVRFALLHQCYDWMLGSLKTEWTGVTLRWFNLYTTPFQIQQQ